LIEITNSRNLNQLGQADLMHIKAFQISMYSQALVQSVDWAPFKKGFAWRTKVSAE